MTSLTASQFEPARRNNSEFGHHVPVGHDRALGDPSGAAGVHDVASVIRRYGDVRVQSRIGGENLHEVLHRFSRKRRHLAGRDLLEQFPERSFYPGKEVNHTGRDNHLEIRQLIRHCRHTCLESSVQCYQDFCPGILQLVRQLRSGEQWGHAGRSATRLERTDVGNEILRDIGEIDSDHVPTRASAVKECLGKPVRVIHKLLVGERNPQEMQGRSVRQFPGNLSKNLIHGAIRKGNLRRDVRIVCSEPRLVVVVHRSIPFCRKPALKTHEFCCDAFHDFIGSREYLRDPDIPPRRGQWDILHNNRTRREAGGMCQPPWLPSRWSSIWPWTPRPRCACLPCGPR